MGNWIMKLFSSVNTPKRVLMLGLDAAGKTTILYKLHIGEVLTTMPTIGFNVEQLQYKNLTMTIWDVGGQYKIRTLWRHYFTGTDALIYVVDSSDTTRLQEAKEELQSILSHDEMKHATLLIYCNKMDLPNAMSTANVAQAFNLDRMKNRRWFIQGTCATKGDGLYEGMDWLCQQMNKPQPTL